MTKLGCSFVSYPELPGMFEAGLPHATIGGLATAQAKQLESTTLQAADRSSTPKSGKNGHG